MVEPFMFSLVLLHSVRHDLHCLQDMLSRSQMGVHVLLCASSHTLRTPVSVQPQRCLTSLYNHVQVCLTPAGMSLHLLVLALARMPLLHHPLMTGVLPLEQALLVSFPLLFWLLCPHGIRSHHGALL